VLQSGFNVLIFCFTYQGALFAPGTFVFFTCDPTDGDACTGIKLAGSGDFRIKTKASFTLYPTFIGRLGCLDGSDCQIEYTMMDRTEVLPDCVGNEYECCEQGKCTPIF